MKIFLMLSAMFTFYFTFIREDHTLIEVAASGRHALVVSSHASTNIKLYPNHMEYYSKNLWEYSGQLLDTSMFSQIIRNASSPDTLAWEDKELDNLLVVQNRNEEISKKYLVKKLNLLGSKQLRFYTRVINRYNQTDSSDRNIFYFSKPVYSNSGKYAIVQWDNKQRGSSEGGINLYHFQGNQWVEIGLISNWK